MSRPDAPALFPSLRATFPRLVAGLEADRFERVAEGPVIELLGSGYYFAPFDKLSALDAARLISALK